MRLFLLMLCAAALEVGGDALIRAGLKGGGVLLMVLGAAVLVTYGFLLNLNALDFGRLMGLYIVLFFVISQITAVLFFREKMTLSVMVGGILIIGGGLTITCWPP